MRSSSPLEEQHCVARPKTTSSRSDFQKMQVGYKQDENSLLFRKSKVKALSFIRNHLRLVGTLVFLLFVTLSSHRLLSLRATHRQWVNAPITYTKRSCPALEYATLGRNAGKICITTLTDQHSHGFFQRVLRWRNFDGIMELTWQNRKDYADKHGYHLFDASFLIDTSRQPAWSKIIAVSHLMTEEHCDWVLWNDADTLIMNSEIRIEDILPQDSSKDLVIAPDSEKNGYNSGVFLFRNTEWSQRFLQEWWDKTSYVLPPGISLPGDQSAMNAVLRDMTDVEEHVLVTPRCTINSFAKFLTAKESAQLDPEHLDLFDWYQDSAGYYHKGDFIAHAAGIDNKIGALKLLLPEAT